MMKKILRKIWGILPGGIRLKLIRVTQQKFTVSVAAIITNRERKVLLLEHLLRPQMSGWGIPGGFINFGEQLTDAIRREIREETRVELDELEMIRVRTVGRHLEVMFRAQTCNDPQVSSREICSLGWFSVSEMPADMSEIQKALIREVLETDTDDLLADLLEQTAAFSQKP